MMMHVLANPKFMDHLPDVIVSPPATAECSVTLCFLRHAERPADICYMVRNVLIAILQILELFQERFGLIRIMSDPRGHSVSVIAGSNLPGGIGVCFECCVLSGRGLCVCRADHSSRGVQPSVVCLSVMVMPRKRGGPGDLGVCCTMGKRRAVKRLLPRHVRTSVRPRVIIRQLLNRLPLGFYVLDVH
jgi:hypothetical protein